MMERDVIQFINKTKNVDMLRRIYDVSKKRYQLVKQTQAQLVPWAVGGDVQLKPEHQNSRPYDMIGKVVKVNRVKLQVKFDGDVWNVPKTMLVQV